MKTKLRCWWCGEDPLYCEYHDREWGVPVHDDRKIFELAQDDNPAQPRLKPLQGQHLEDLPIVMDRHAPLPVVILTVQRILPAPPAPRLTFHVTLVSFK